MSQLILDTENHKLSTLAKYLNIKQVNYHNSLEDAQVCGTIFYELYDTYVEFSSLNSKKKSSGSYYSEYLKRIDNQKDIVDKYIWNCSNKLSGKTFVVSGVFEKFSRDDLKKAIEDNGGKVGSSISAKTDFVVAGENMGPAKLEKANQLGISIISEDDFIQMINEN